MAQVAVEISGDIAKLAAALNKANTKIEGLERGLKKTGRTGKSAGGQIQKAFGMAAGIVGIGSFAAVFSRIVNLASKAKEEITGIAGGMKEVHEEMKGLWQITESKEAYKQLSGEAKLAMARSGMSRQRSYAMTFGLKTLGRLEGAIPTVAATAAYMTPEQAAQFYTTITAEATWGKEVGKPENVFSGLIKGAFRSAFEIPETAQWFARSAALVKMATDTSPAELLGVGAAVSKSTAFAESPERLGTAMIRFATGLEKMGYGGEGLIGGFERFRKEEPELYQQYRLGNERFKKLADTLVNVVPLAQEYTAEISEAFKEGTAHRRKIEEAPLEITRLHRAEIARVHKELALEPRAAKQIELETSIDRIKAMAGWTDTSLVVDQAWESALQAGATMGMIDIAAEKANQILIDRIREHYPKIFEEQIAGKVPWTEAVPARRPGGMYMGRPAPMLPAIPSRPDVPRQMTPELAAGIEHSFMVIAEREIRKRQGMAPMESTSEDSIQKFDNAVTRFEAAMEEVVRNTGGGTTLAKPDEDR